MRRLFTALAGAWLVTVVAVASVGAPPAAADESSPPATSPASAEPPPSMEPAPVIPTPEPTSEPTPIPTTTPTPTTAPTPATAPKRPASRLPLRAGAHGWRVAALQDRLAWLGYDISASSRAAQSMGATTVTAVERIQAKWGYRPTGVVGPATWALVAEKAGTVGRLPAACRTGLAVCVDKSTRLVRLVRDGDVEITLDARFGFTGAETREGTFRVLRKSRDHVSSLYRTSMPFAMFFSGGQAVHYSPYFARDGYRGGSHGCVNLRDYRGARWLYDHVPLGTTVHVYWS